MTVKNAIADNAEIDIDTDTVTTVTTDGNGVDHIAEQIAEEVYEMFEPASIDEPGPRGKEGCFRLINLAYLVNVRVEMVKKILVAPLLFVFFITYLFFGGFTMIISEIIDKLLNWVEIGSEANGKVLEKKDDWRNRSAK